jgi:hypothetical protein
VEVCTRGHILAAVSFAEWLVDFRALHELARREHLSGDLRDAYLARRHELTQALVAVQQRFAPPGANRRKMLRVVRALRLELETMVGRERALTMNLSVGGFSALLAKAPRQDEVVKCLLRLPAGKNIEAAVRPVGTRHLPRSAQVSFAFGELTDAERERLELLIFDTALELLA